MDIYDKHLRRVGMIIVVLRVFLILFFIVTVGIMGLDSNGVELWAVLCKAGLSLAMAFIAFFVTKHRDWVKYTLICSILLLIAMVVVLVMDVHSVDSVMDVSLLLIVLVIFLQLQIRKRVKKMDIVNKRETNTLDLRISGHGDLFNPLVMGPHLEPNQGIIDAIDRFLLTTPSEAPLTLCFHSAEPVSEYVQETLGEVLRLHYADEMKRVERFMESRYIRAILLIIASVGVLRLLSGFTGVGKGGVVWQVFSNFAAFSLWQIFATYFERAEAFEELMRYKIAMDCNMLFY